MKKLNHLKANFEKSINKHLNFFEDLDIPLFTILRQTSKVSHENIARMPCVLYAFPFILNRLCKGLVRKPKIVHFKGTWPLH